MKAEHSRHFGGFTRWEAMCQEQDVTTVEGQILLAEDVLAAPTTGTNAEWLPHHLRLKGSQSFDVDGMLAGCAPAGKDVG